MIILLLGYSEHVGPENKWLDNSQDISELKYARWHWWDWSNGNLIEESNLSPEVKSPSRILSDSPDGKLSGIEPLIKFWFVFALYFLFVLCVLYF